MSLEPVIYAQTKKNEDPIGTVKLGLTDLGSHYIKCDNNIEYDTADYPDLADKVAKYGYSANTGQVTDVTATRPNAYPTGASQFATFFQNNRLIVLNTNTNSILTYEDGVLVGTTNTTAANVIWTKMESFGGVFFGYTTAGRIAKSADNGVTWQFTLSTYAGIPTGVARSNIQGLGYDPATDTALFTTGQLLYKMVGTTVTQIVSYNPANLSSLSQATMNYRCVLWESTAETTGRWIVIGYCTDSGSLVQNFVIDATQDLTTWTKKYQSIGSAVNATTGARFDTIKKFGTAYWITAGENSSTSSCWVALNYFADVLRAADNLFGGSTVRNIETTSDSLFSVSTTRVNRYNDNSLNVSAGTSEWSDIVTDTYRTLALKTDGTIWEWGVSSADGTTINHVPVQIGTSNNWTKITAGGNSLAAINSSGELWVWGQNAAGELGVGDTDPRYAPTKLSADTFIDVSLAHIYNGSTYSATFYSGQFMLAVRNDGTLWASGRNTTGQLGNGTTTSVTSLTQIGTSTDWQKVFTASAISDSSLQAGTSFAIKTDGTLWAWGFNSQTNYICGTNSTSATILTPTQVGTDTNWSYVSCVVQRTNTFSDTNYNGGFALALKTNGTLWAWGNNAVGNLGTSDTTTKSIPTQVGSSTNWQSITTGRCGFLPGSTIATNAWFSYACNTNGQLYAWGNNAYKQLFDNTVTQSNSPKLVTFINASSVKKVFNPMPTVPASKSIPSFLCIDNNNKLLTNGVGGSTSANPPRCINSNNGSTTAQFTINCVDYSGIEQRWTSLSTSTTTAPIEVYDNGLAILNNIASVAGDVNGSLNANSFKLSFFNSSGITLYDLPSALAVCQVSGAGFSNNVVKMYLQQLQNFYYWNDITGSITATFRHTTQTQSMSIYRYCNEAPTYLYCLVGSEVMRTQDGVNWTSCGINPAIVASNAYYTNYQGNKFVYFKGAFYVSIDGCVLKSTNLYNWTAFTSNAYNALSVTNDYLIALGANISNTSNISYYNGTTLVNTTNTSVATSSNASNDVKFFQINSKWICFSGYNAVNFITSSATPTTGWTTLSEGVTGASSGVYLNNKLTLMNSASKFNYTTTTSSWHYPSIDTSNITLTSTFGALINNSSNINNTNESNSVMGAIVTTNYHLLVTLDGLNWTAYARPATALTTGYRSVGLSPDGTWAICSDETNRKTFKVALQYTNPIPTPGPKFRVPTYYDSTLQRYYYIKAK